MRFSLRFRLIATIIVACLAWTVMVASALLAVTPATVELAELRLDSAQSRLELAARDPSRPARPVPGVDLSADGRTLWLGEHSPARRERALGRERDLRLGGVDYHLHSLAPGGTMLLDNPAGLGRVLLRALLLALFAGPLGLLLTYQLRAALSPFKAALQGDLGTLLPPSTDPDLSGPVAAFNELAERLQRTEQELLRNEAELCQAQTHKARTLAMVSHELRTPLTAVLGYADRIEDGPELQRCGGRLLSRLDRLLEWARLDADQVRPHLEELELNEVLEAALRGSAPELELWPEPIWIKSDFRWLTRVLESLFRAGTSRIAVRTFPELTLRLEGARPLDPGDRIGDDLSLTECERVLRALGARLTVEDGHVEVIL